jgi:hypothetical protein
MTAVVILAHQGGWDEILMVLAPIGLMAGLLRLAKRRVEAKQAADGGTDGSPSSAATDAASSPVAPDATTRLDTQ